MRTDPPTRGVKLTGDWYAVGHPGIEEEFGRVLVRLGDEQGRTVCTGLVIDSDGAIEATSLRDLPLPSIVSFLAEIHRMVDAPAFTELEDAPAGRPTYTEQHYREVADAYRAGLQARPGAPVRWIIDRHLAQMQHPPSEATVRRWVRTARQMGLIEEGS